MKNNRLVSLMSLAVLSLSIANAHADITTEWVNESGDYSVGEWVGNWQVLEYKDAVAYNANNVWTTEGVSGGIIDPLTNSSVLWFYYPASYATVGFSQPSTSVAFMLESDGNDGLVNFYVDNAEVLHHFDMQTLPVERLPGSWVGTLVVSGLEYGQHSVKIESAPDFAFSSGRNDFHMYGAAAVSPVPAPAAVWLWLAGCGLLGLTGMRKRSEG